MENLSSEIIGLIYQLLPGFISACIFYLLTCYIKPDPFERVIQALIFTVLCKSIIIVIKNALFFIGTFWTIGIWTSNIEFVSSIIISILFGIFLSWCVNNDFPLFLFRKDGIEKCNKFNKFMAKYFTKLNLTNKALHPTEWYSFFKESECFAILHIEGERRLQGYLLQFPNTPDSGHFIISNASWLLDDGTVVPLLTVDKMLLSAKEVLRVELLKNGNFDSNEINDNNKHIYELYNNKTKEAQDVNQCTEATFK